MGGASGVPAVRAAMAAAELGPESALEAPTAREATLIKSSATPSLVLVCVCGVAAHYCLGKGWGCSIVLAHTCLICLTIQHTLT